MCGEEEVKDVACSHTDTTSRSHLLSLTLRVTGKEKTEDCVSQMLPVSAINSLCWTWHDHQTYKLTEAVTTYYIHSQDQARQQHGWRRGKGLWSSASGWGAICNWWPLGKKELGLGFSFFFFSEVKRKFGLYKNKYNRENSVIFLLVIHKNCQSKVGREKINA